MNRACRFAFALRTTALLLITWAVGPSVAAEPNSSPNGGPATDLEKLGDQIANDPPKPVLDGQGHQTKPDDVLKRLMARLHVDRRGLPFGPAPDDGNSKTAPAAKRHSLSQDISEMEDGSRHEHALSFLDSFVVAVLVCIVCIAFGQFEFKLHPSTRMLIFLVCALAAAGAYAWEQDLKRGLDAPPPPLHRARFGNYNQK